MSTLETIARDAACNAIVDLIDVGGNGSLTFTTAADALLATLPFTGAAFGSSSVGVATMNDPTPDTDVEPGTCTKAKFLNGSAALVLSGTVALSAADINLSKVDIKRLRY